MKYVILIVVLGVVAALVVNYAKSTVEEGFDPTEQGQQARAAIEKCATWTEVLDKGGEPSKWRNSHSAFDFRYYDNFDASEREKIGKKIEKGELDDGFSFFYRFSDAVTFAVNFDGKGQFLNIQDKEGKSALMGN